MNYDLKARNWDDESRIKRAKIISDEISKAIEIKGYYNALEFGCGTGLISFNLKERFEEITLVDTSRGMIEVLNSKIQQNHVTNMVAYQMDLNGQQHLEDKFDVIYTSMVLHHIRDTEKTIGKLCSMLNRNGYLCIVDLDEEDGSFHCEDDEFDGHNGFNQDALAEILRKAGLMDVESYSFYKGTKATGEREVDYSLFLMKGHR